MRRFGVLALLALTGCGSSGDGGAERFDPFTQVRDRNTAYAQRASARWEPIATLTGSGASTKAFAVAREAIQWRARWRCDTGRLKLTATASGRTVAEATCPAHGIGTDVRTGAQELRVQASGRWRVTLEQQVDTPLREPPLKSMRSPAARVLAAGRFYGLERPGRGGAALYRLPGGRLALRLDGFATSANSDLYVWLSAAAKPRNTVQAARAPHRVLAPLKSTIGEQNYLIPRGLDASRIRSVVIWCVPVRIAYTAAPLRATAR